jgi:type III pantothenate kinase
LSAIEALACGVPVIASAVGGLTDFVRNDDNGITCPPRNPEALAAAIRLLLDDPARRERLAARARASVETAYDERVVFGRFADLARALSGVPV